MLNYKTRYCINLIFSYFFKWFLLSIYQLDLKCYKNSFVILFIEARFLIPRQVIHRLKKYIHHSKTNTIVATLEFKNIIVMLLIN